MKKQTPIKGFYFAKADNTQLKLAKSLIFSVLEEYGLIPDNPSLDRDLEDIEQHYQNGYFGLIFNKEDQCVGTFALYNMGNHLAEIRKMYLLPEVRGKGLGTWMVNFLIALAKERQFKRLELDTASVLKEAIQLYEKLGFQAKSAEKPGPRCDRAYFMDL